MLFFLSGFNNDIYIFKSIKSLIKLKPHHHPGYFTFYLLKIDKANPIKII